MLRLLSGAGIDGLAAMKAIDIRTDLTIWRPLLIFLVSRFANGQQI